MIPSPYKELAQSAELYDKVEKIGGMFDLHIDQIGELDAEIRDVLEGTAKASDFSAHIAERLEVDKGKAALITEEVNKQLFEVLKKQLQNETSVVPRSVPPPANTSSLEQAGGFSIEPEEQEDTESKPPRREDILAGIEEPEPSLETVVPKNPQSAHTDPIIDHLLTTPTSVPEQKSRPEAPPPSAPKPSTPPAQSKPQRSGPDPYREPVK